MSHRHLSLPLLLAALSIGVSGPLAAADRSVAQQLEDVRRQTQIWTTYITNESLRANDLSVEVIGDRAILEGTVESSVERELAEEIARGVDGITQVDNRVKIDAAYQPKAAVGGERDFATTVRDASISSKVKSKLLWNDHTDGLDINVNTMFGRVTLKGTADSAASRDLAGRIAANTEGVVAVDNLLVIGAPPKAAAVDGLRADAARAEQKLSDGWISAKVKSTLLFSRNIDGSNIGVETQQGVVRLKGRVTAPTEKDAAVALASGVRGVKQVDASGLVAAP